jgi:replication factor A1
LAEEEEKPEDSAEDLARKVMEAAGYSRDQLQAEMDKKRAEYDMLTEEGALTLIASEMGVSQDEQREAPSMTIQDLKAGMQDIDVVGRIVRINQPREFVRRDGSPGYVCSLMAADATGSVRITLWDQECRLLEDVGEGDILRIMGGVVKTGRSGLEIHTARRARFALNPNEAEDPRVAALDSVVEPPEPSVVRCKVSEIEDGAVNIEIRATIVKLYRVWIYDACPRCGRKATEGRCQLCGIVESVPRAILDAGVDDSSGFLRAKFFGELAEQVLGSGAGEMQEEISALVERGMDSRRAAEEYLNREHMAMLGEEILLRGRVALDEYRGLVLSVDGFSAPDPVSETGMVLEEVGV